MNTFLIIRQIGEQAGPDVLKATAEAAVRRLNAFPDPDKVEVAFSDGGLCVIAPAEPDGRSLVSLHVANDHIVAAYGEPDEPETVPLATRLAARYAGGGLDAAATLPGCFGAAIYDLATGQVLIVSDGVGQRSPRHAQVGDLLLISPHDLPMIAAGLQVAPRTSAVASLFRFGWSFGGDSLIEGSMALPPEQVRVIDRSGNVAEMPQPVHVAAVAQRRRPLDPLATVDEIIDAMVGYMRVNHAAGTRVDVELSAGFDSRAVLGLALAAYPGDLVSFTDGPPTSQDVVIAGRVAAAVGIPHKGGGVRSSTATERLAAVSALAAGTNGQATVIPIMTGGFAPQARDSLGGDGGEIYLGYFYPKLGTGKAGAYSVDQVTDHVMNKVQPGARWLSPDWNGRLRSLVKARLERLAPFCERNADAHDLLYLLERTANWNQKIRRMPSRRFNPFYSRAAIYAFLGLPGVRGGSAVHATIMARYVAKARWIMLNGETMPALLAGSGARRKLGKSMTFAAKARRRLVKRFRRTGAPVDTNDLEQVRMNIFHAHLEADWYDLLAAENATCRSVLGDRGVGPLLAATRAGDPVAAQVAATMIVVETFFAQARQLAAA